MPDCWLCESPIDLYNAATPRCGHGLHETCYHELLGGNSNRVIRCPKCRGVLDFSGTPAQQAPEQTQVPDDPPPAYSALPTYDSQVQTAVVDSMPVVAQAPVRPAFLPAANSLPAMTRRRDDLERWMRQTDPPYDAATKDAMKKELNILYGAIEAARSARRGGGGSRNGLDSSYMYNPLYY